jgi:carbon monoxide dehydrogenase subunit G
MLRFEGEKELALPPTEVWTKLHDVRFLQQCIPGSESVVRVEADQLVCVLRPGFAFVRGTLEMTLRVLEAEPTNLIRIATHAKGIGSSTDVETLLSIAAQDGGTRVHWTTEIKSLGGLLKAVPQGLIKAAAQKVIADAWAAVEAKLHGEYC